MFTDLRQGLWVINVIILIAYVIFLFLEDNPYPDIWNKQIKIKMNKKTNQQHKMRI